MTTEPSQPAHEHEWTFCCQYMDCGEVFDHDTCWCGAESWGGEVYEPRRNQDDEHR